MDAKKYHNFTFPLFPAQLPAGWESALAYVGDVLGVDIFISKLHNNPDRKPHYHILLHSSKPRSCNYMFLISHLVKCDNVIPISTPGAFSEWFPLAELGVTI